MGETLVSRDYLQGRIKVMQSMNPKANNGSGWACNFLNDAQEPSVEWYNVEDMIENAPVIDAVLVVRCKDCVHNNGLVKNGLGGIMVECDNYCRACGLHVLMPQDYFCADGETRE